MARILIVDDHDFVRHGVRNVLEMQDDWEVIGEAADGQQGLRLYQQLKPDAVVMDITMPVMSGLDATSELVTFRSSAPIAIRSSS